MDNTARSCISELTPWQSMNLFLYVSSISQFQTNTMVAITTIAFQNYVVSSPIHLYIAHSTFNIHINVCKMWVLSQQSSLPYSKLARSLCNQRPSASIGGDRIQEMGETTSVERLQRDRWHPWPLKPIAIVIAQSLFVVKEVSTDHAT